MNGERMPVLSIIACEMLEDELAYVLSEDHDLGQLFESLNPEIVSSDFFLWKRYLFF